MVASMTMKHARWGGAARPKAPGSTPPCMFPHRTSHQPSSNQAKLEGNIPCSTSLMSHAQRHLTPPHRACSATTQPSKHRAGPRKGGIHHNNVPHSTRFMPHAQRHPTPPHLACFIVILATIHSPHTRDSQLEGNIATFRAQ